MFIETLLRWKAKPPAANTSLMNQREFKFLIGGRSYNLQVYEVLHVGEDLQTPIICIDVIERREENRNESSGSVQYPAVAGGEAKRAKTRQDSDGQVVANLAYLFLHMETPDQGGYLR